VSGPTGTFTLSSPPLAAPQFNEERKKKKNKTQSLKLFEFFLYQMSMVLTAGGGPPWETAPPALARRPSHAHPSPHAQCVSFPSGK